MLILPLVTPVIYPEFLGRFEFSSPVSNQQWTPPAGTKFIFAKAWGAGGGTGINFGDRNGGAGGFVKGLFNISQFTKILNLGVGGRGVSNQNGPPAIPANGGGINGGGNRSGNFPSGGGGGWTGILIGNTPIIIAGGGGGSGGSSDLSNTHGGSAGYPAGAPCFTSGGGTQIAGGAGGGDANAIISGGTIDARGGAGSLYVGGSGFQTVESVGTGGGGGGYYGGGGGGFGSSHFGGTGGGGGSSYYDISISSNVTAPTNVGQGRTPQGVAIVDPDYPGNEIAYGAQARTTPPPLAGNGHLVIYCYSRIPSTLP